MPQGLGTKTILCVITPVYKATFIRGQFHKVNGTAQFWLIM
jgi:hypothetical protein